MSGGAGRDVHTHTVPDAWYAGRRIPARSGAQVCRTRCGDRSLRAFFFSSRRRHTRFDCDWSSDVCSSDLDAYLRVADQVLWRLFSASYSLEQTQDAVHWCAEGRRRFPKNPRFTECQLWVLTLKDVDPDVPKAWHLLAELRDQGPAQQAEFDRLRDQILVAAVLARAGAGDSARHLLARSRADAQIDRERE